MSTPEQEKADKAPEQPARPAPRTLPARPKDPEPDPAESSTSEQAKGSPELLPPAQYEFADDDEHGPWGNLPVQMRHYEDGTPAS